MHARKQLMVFVMGAAVLLTLATSLIVIGHYWQMLSGIWLIAILGVLLPDWVSFWGSKWYAAEDEDRRVKFTAFVVTFLMAVTMTLNAGAILATRYDNDQLAAREARTAEGAKGIETAKQTGNVEAINARARQIQQMKAAGMSERTIREVMRAEATRDSTVALSAAPAKPQAETEGGYVSQVPAPIKAYMGFWVYIVPFLIGLVGKFALGAAIALPGGAEFGRPTSQRRVDPLPAARGTVMAEDERGK